jgi:hypothetical protein
MWASTGPSTRHGRRRRRTKTNEAVAVAKVFVSVAVEAVDERAGSGRRKVGPDGGRGQLRFSLEPPTVGR